MNTATVRDVQHDLRRLLDRVSSGETVEITRRGCVVARMAPPPRPGLVLPDFLARMRSYGKGSVVSDRKASELLAELRGER